MSTLNSSCELSVDRVFGCPSIEVAGSLGRRAGGVKAGAFCTNGAMNEPKLIMSERLVVLNTTRDQLFPVADW